MKTIGQAVSESTCLKRVTVCRIYDSAGNVIATESNRCIPPNGECCRMSVSNSQADYPEHSTCNWTHAEEMAISAIPKFYKPHSATIFGHDFPCPPCEAKLRAIGVVEIEVVSIYPGCGLRIASEAQCQ